MSAARWRVGARGFLKRRTLVPSDRRLSARAGSAAWACRRRRWCFGRRRRGARGARALPPPTFPHAILVVLHVSPPGTSMLPAILARACSLPVLSPADGEPLRDGHVYVA